MQRTRIFPAVLGARPVAYYRLASIEDCSEAGAAATILAWVDLAGWFI
jgi:hypothetical protein